MIMSEDNAKNYARVRRWREKHRGLVNLRQREYRKGKKSGLGEKEAAVESNRSRTEMARNEMKINPDYENASHTVEIHAPDWSSGVDDAPRPSVAELREMMAKASEKPSVEVPASTDTRSRSDIAMGIWRNDQGGVISKFAYDKLQKMKEHAKEKNFEIDEYSQ